MRILVIGPSKDKSKGGMSTVIKEMSDDQRFTENYNMEFYDSYIDGSKVKVMAYSIFAYLKFVFSGKQNKYDIYHIHVASHGSTFRKMLYVKSIKKHNKKVIMHIHGAEYMKFFENLSPKNKNKIIDCLKSCDTVIALSDDWKMKFEKSFGLKNCVVIENGINMMNFRDSISDIKDNPHTFVSLGRLGYRKGTYDILDAVEIVSKKIPDILIYLGGDGEIDKAKEIVAEKKLENNVRIVGWADFEKKIKLLKEASVFLLPSYNEGLPMAILEAMACGKAIISTTVGAIPEVIDKNNGILIVPGDVHALSEAMIKMCTDTEYVNEISHNNINKIKEKYDMILMHKKIEDVYTDLYNEVLE